MKRLFLVLGLISITVVNISARELFGHIYFGLQTVEEKQVRESYGNGAIFSLNVELQVWHSLCLGAAYEGGYSQDAIIGNDQENSTLKMSGAEIYLKYTIKIKQFLPFTKFGIHKIFYKQTIDSPYEHSYHINDSKNTYFVAAGFQFTIHKSFYLLTEMKYVPARVTPANVEIDLSGFRYLVGIGYQF